MAHTKLIFLNDHHLDDGGNENHGKSRRFQPKNSLPRHSRHRVGNGRQLGPPASADLYIFRTDLGRKSLLISDRFIISCL